MLKRLVLSILILFIGVVIIAQNSDCSTALSICDGDSIFVGPNGNGSIIEFTDSSNISNPSSNPNLGNSFGCMLLGEVNSTWVLFTIESGGTLEFSIGSLAIPGYLDWTIWPYNSSTCNGIINNTLPPIACKWTTSDNGLIGMCLPGNLPAGANQGNFENAITVNTGDHFIMCFNNELASNNYLPFTSFGTASILCTNVNCQTSSSSIDSVIVGGDKCTNVCNGEVSIFATSIYDSLTYSLNNTISNYSGIFDSLCFGTYIISMEDSLGCIRNSLVSYSQSNTSLTLSDTITNSCVGSCDSIVTFSSASLDLNWSHNGTTISQDSILIFCPDDDSEIYVYGLNSLGCSTDTLLTVFDVPTHNGLITPVLDTVILGDTISLCLNTIDSNFTYTWFTGDTTSCISVAPITSGDYCLYITDSCGYTNLICSDLFVLDASGINDNTDENIRVLNSISSDGFSIEIIGLDYLNMSFEIYNQTGKLLLNKRISSSLTYTDISTYSKGMYFVIIRNKSDLTFVTKIIKQ